MALAAALVLALLVAGFAYQQICAARDQWRFPPPGRLVDVGRGRLHVIESGPSKAEGPYVPTVILDAGIAASSLSWLRVAPRVAEFARVVSYDRSGFAWSERTHGRVSAGSLAAELHVLLQKAAIAPPYVLVAHSFGTFVVRAFAGQFPRDVSGLVLVDPIFPAEWMKMPAKERRRLRGGVLLSYIGAALASVGFVRWCLNRLAAGSPAGPRIAARLFGSEAASVLKRLVRQVQKLPHERLTTFRSSCSLRARSRSPCALNTLESRGSPHAAFTCSRPTPATGF
jgi:pimeloyl-ACP methyl ester carboxylesterase